MGWHQHFGALLLSWIWKVWKNLVFQKKGEYWSEDNKYVQWLKHERGMRHVSLIQALLYYHVTLRQVFCNCEAQDGYVGCASCAWKR